MGLRRRGIDVLRAQEVDLADVTDDVHLAFAFRERRVMVSQDADFIILVEQGNSNCGLAYCEQGSRSIGEMISALVLIYEILSPDEMRNHIEYL